MLPTERHFGGSGHTAHGIAASYSAWHTPIACVGVVVLYQWGYWLFPACPRTYPLPGSIKAGLLPSSALSCTLSPVLRTPRTPSRLRSLSAFRLYTPGLCPTRLPGRVSRSAFFSGNVPPPSTPERSSSRSGLDCCLLPSPRHDRLGPFKHLSADNMTWLQRSLNVAARFLAPVSFNGF